MRAAQPSPYLHVIVGFCSLAMAWTMLPSSHAAPTAYPLLDSVTTCLLVSYWRLAHYLLPLPSSSSLCPLVLARSPFWGLEHVTRASSYALDPPPCLNAPYASRTHTYRIRMLISYR